MAKNQRSRKSRKASPAPKPRVGSKKRAAAQAAARKEKLAPRELALLATLSLVIGAVISFTALYQALRLGFFFSGNMASAILAWPIVRYFISRADPKRAAHLTNYLQTAVSTSGAAVGMGSTLLVLQWVTGQPVAGWEAAAIALPGSLFGVAAANGFAGRWLNVDRLPFPSGMATGNLLLSLAGGGRAFQTLAAGAVIGATLFVFDAPIAAAALGTGWILGYETLAWALGTALALHLAEPALRTAELIAAGAKDYRDISVFLGAAMVLAAGAVDIVFNIFFRKTLPASELGEVRGLMSRKANVGFLVGSAALMAISAWAVFGLPPHITLGVAVFALVLAYVAGTCLGRTGTAPVSSMAGVVILLALGLGKESAILYGAMAIQILAGGLDQVDDYRTGERVGSHFPTQRRWEIAGAVLGASVGLGLTYALITSAWPESLTLNAVREKGNLFNAGMAIKFYGFLSLREKLAGPVGQACLWALGFAAMAQLARHLLVRAGWNRAARFVPSPFAMSLAMFVPFGTVWQQACGAAMGALALIVWRRFGRPVASAATGKEEPALFGRLPLSALAGLPAGLIVAESLGGFISAIIKLFR